MRKKSSVPSRRRFIGGSLAAAAGLLLPRPSLAQSSPTATARLAALRARFPDLRRRFVFEYYPWYGASPWRHWDAENRTPPWDVAAPYMPLLGAYDSRSRAVIEQHARWIADSGVGSVNLSWWGPDSFEDRAAHGVMDVMRDHDLKVTFHLEPYAPDRGRRFTSDVLYLLQEYGERRRFDCLLLLRDPGDGALAPVFKGFDMILPPTARDCRGVDHPVANHTVDTEWQQQTRALRSVLRGDFDRIWLLADSMDMGRVAASGFDGIAVYDPRVDTKRYWAAARAATSEGLLFSFNVNPGFNVVRPRERRVDECGQPILPPPFVPGGDLVDLSNPAGHERAADLGRRRIIDSFEATLAVQTDPSLSNARRGFFLAYVNSFNEWHEGTAFEPMKSASALVADEQGADYRNPQRGDYRLALLKELLRG